MSEPTMTVERLKVELWWWTQDGKLDLLREALGGNGVDVGPGARLERVAFYYEMARRGNPKYRDLPTYWRLRDEGADFRLETLAEPSHVAASKDVWGLGPGEARDSNWQPLDSGLLWNLTLSDRLLAEAFLTQIHALRRKHNVSKATVNKGFRNRGLSWHRLEVLDLSHYKLGPLDDTDRSDLAKAKRQAKELARVCRPVLEELFPGDLSAGLPV